MPDFQFSVSSAHAKALKFGRPLPLLTCILYQRPYRRLLLFNLAHKRHTFASADDSSAIQRHEGLQACKFVSNAMPRVVIENIEI